METLCVIWFTTEYFLRLFACPDKLEFLRDKGPFAYDVPELEINDLVYCPILCGNYVVTTHVIYERPLAERVGHRLGAPLLRAPHHLLARQHGHL